MSVGLWVVCIVAAVWIIDRVGLWLERRGYIYWRRRGRGGLSGVAVGPVVEAFAPSYKYVMQERDRQQLEIKQTGLDEPWRTSDRRGDGADESRLAGDRWRFDSSTFDMLERGKVSIELGVQRTEEVRNPENGAGS